MNYLRSILLLLHLLLCTATGMFAQPGTLDPSFSDDGINTITMGDFKLPRSIAMQPDGKILIGGNIYQGIQKENFALWRLLENGDLDNTFGIGGVVIKNMGGRDYIEKIILLPDGKILTAGTKHGATLTEFIVARFNPDGQVDLSFANQGVSRITVPYTGEVNDMIILPDNKILLDGRIKIITDQKALVRLLQDGTIDSTLNDDGVLLPIQTPGSWINHLAIQPDGKILATGTRIGNTSAINDPWYYFTARFLPDCTMDSTFGTGGYIEELFSEEEFSSESSGIAVQEDGKIIMSGLFTLDTLGGSGVAIRYMPNGQLDNTFGLGGKAFVPYPISVTPNAMALQADGKIVVGGASFNWPLSTETDQFIARFNNDGQLDNTFGSSGVSVLLKSGTYDYVLALTLQADGKIVTVGKSDNPDLLITRYFNDINVGLISLASANTPMLVYPNPIALEANLRYELAQQEPVTIQLFDINGVLLTTYLNNQSQSSGPHVFNFSLASSLPAGTYVLMLSTAKNVKSIQLVKP